MIFRHFWLATVFGILLSGSNSGFDIFLELLYFPRSIQIQLPFDWLWQASRRFEMKGCDGTDRTIDNTPDFLKARICVGLSLRHDHHASFAAWRGDMGGIG